jgi:chitinase
MEKERILKQIENAQNTRGCTLNITLPAAMDYIRNMGGYDFFINDFLGVEKALYIHLYNKDGKFINNHLWGFYNDLEILKIFYNIIKNEY